MNIAARRTAQQQGEALGGQLGDHLPVDPQEDVLRRQPHFRGVAARIDPADEDPLLALLDLEPDAEAITLIAFRIY